MRQKQNLGENILRDCLISHQCKCSFVEKEGREKEKQRQGKRCRKREGLGKEKIEIREINKKKEARRMEERKEDLPIRISCPDRTKASCVLTKERRSRREKGVLSVTWC